MKNAESLLQSATARLMQAKLHAHRVQTVIDGMNRDGIDGREIAAMTAEAERMLQCVHEFNAYWNAFETA